MPTRTPQAQTPAPTVTWVVLVWVPTVCVRGVGQRTVVWGQHTSGTSEIFTCPCEQLPWKYSRALNASMLSTAPTGSHCLPRRCCSPPPCSMLPYQSPSSDGPCGWCTTTITTTDSHTAILARRGGHAAGALGVGYFSQQARRTSSAPSIVLTSAYPGVPTFLNSHYLMQKAW